MAANSKIEWTDHSFNPWWGCVKARAVEEDTPPQPLAACHHREPRLLLALAPTGEGAGCGARHQLRTSARPHLEKRLADITAKLENEQKRREDTS